MYVSTSAAASKQKEKKKKKKFLSFGSFPSTPLVVVQPKIEKGENGLGNNSSLGLHTDEEPQPLNPVLWFDPGEALEPSGLEQEIDPFHALRLLLTLVPLASGGLVPASVGARDVSLLRGAQATPFLM